MADEISQMGLLQEMLQLLKRFQAGGSLAAIEDRGEWDELVESKTAEESELLKELARFSDLWRYLQDRKEKLGPEVVSGIRQLHKLRTSARIAQLQEINQKLMERVANAGQGAKFRH